MRFTVAFSLLLLASSCWGTSTITDGVNDQVGYQANFDITSASLNATSTSTTISLLFNYGQDTAHSTNTNAWKTFAGFKQCNSLPSTGCSATLYVGDLFFFDPSDTTFTTPEYGISLVNRTTAAGVVLKAGDIYGIGTVQKSSDLFSSGYGNNTEVWINTITGGGPLATGIVSTPVLSNGDVLVTVQFSSSAFSGTPLSAYFSGAKGVGFQFESATCANDVITGVFTPEPSTLAMAFGGLLLAGIGRLRRKKRTA